ncbi:hypothetical protein Q669_07065 [Labrenzia sp. C1B10]|nr:hypothetical protein Q669_07065 [Labrenzia sp. C1B10]ERP99852.1 hypothetical protein Q675_14855 [Labrenzia sp. C1B70]
MGKPDFQNELKRNADRQESLKGNPINFTIMTVVCRNGHSWR